MITAQQSKAARGLLEWSQRDLSACSSVGESTIKNFESGKRATTAPNIMAIKQAFENAGIVFLEDGVRKVER